MGKPSRYIQKIADAPEQESAYDGLTSTDQALVDDWLSTGMVQCRSYFRTVYSGKKKDPHHTSVRTAASRKFTEVHIKAAIDEKLNEMAMSANEVLRRLSEQAENAQSQFIDGNGEVDLFAMKNAGLMHLVKSTKRNPQGALIVEFHDAQSALKELAKIRGLSVERLGVKLEFFQVEMPKPTD